MFVNWMHKNIGKNQARRILFSDEKKFTIDGVYNRQNHRVWASTRSAADVEQIHQKHKFPQSVMVWMGVCYDGITKVVILNDKVNGEYYINNVLHAAYSEGVRMLGTHNWIFQQDGARCHTAKKTQNWCLQNFPSFIPASKWPPNSPDLNPMDYSIWTELCNNMNWNIKTKNELINSILNGATKIRESVIKNSIDSWMKRCNEVEQSGGEILMK